MTYQKALFGTSLSDGTEARFNYKAHTWFLLKKMENVARILEKVTKKRLKVSEK